jgi:NAD+ synthase (glutamine-hydrolysing)
VGGVEVPVGDITFDCGGLLIGFEICEDAWIAQRPGVKLALGEVDVILNPSASHFAFGKHEVRRRLVLESSRALKTSYVYANLLGNEAGRAIYDGDVLIANAGEMVAQGVRFSFTDHLLVSAVVDLDLARSRQASLTSEPSRVATLRESCVRVPFVVPDTSPERSSVCTESWETTQDVKNEEFVRAVSLGLFDYLRKSQARGFVVSLSGGADSSAVACLVAYMVSLARAWLDPGEVRRKLPFLDETHESATAEVLTRQLLTTVYQSTRNSSARTRAAARAVAEELGAEHVELDVDPLVEQYVALASDALGRRLTWSSDDVALQNIQARVRSPGAWLIANVKRALLLSTSNRSEAAVGYATMDGDTAGGVSPIAGIDKAFLRRWLQWVERVGPSDLRPVSALASVTRQEPTAELRPAEAAQTDEADLMPYDVLDFIERAAIRDKRTPAEVYTLLRVDRPETPPQTLVLWIERFFLLFSKNQWKRERYAPSFHLDDANLDPKTWCRFPVLSGGFARELRELRSLVQQDERGDGSWNPSHGL